MPAGAGGYYYPAAAGILARGPTESEADYARRVQAQADEEARANSNAARTQREAAERDAALRAAGLLTSTTQTGLSEGFATERARIEAESRTAQERARSQAEVERIRLETQRDIEVARARAAQPNVSLSPLETTPPPPATRTDSASQQFPTGAVIGIGAAALLLLALTKGK